MHCQWGRLNSYPYLIHGSLGPPESARPTGHLHRFIVNKQTTLLMSVTIGGVVLRIGRNGVADELFLSYDIRSRQPVCSGHESPVGWKHYTAVPGA